MKYLSKANRIDIKRAFVVSNHIARNGMRRYLPMLSRNDFSLRLVKAKRYAKKLNAAQLDRVIGKTSKRRRDAYNKLHWNIGVVNANEVAVWKGAGGLPIAWTRGSLSSTAKKVGHAMRKNQRLLKKRARQSIPGILAISARAIQEDRYLLPIILPPGTMRNCRAGMKKFKGDIDDGCMRSIALAINGKKTIKAYIGSK